MRSRHDVSIERGTKRVFAWAIEWPGWCRSGRTEEAALEALVEYGPRYARVVGRRKLGFLSPAVLGDLRVVERLEGNATTDFGAPGVAPRADERSIEEDERDPDCPLKWTHKAGKKNATDAATLRRYLEWLRKPSAPGAHRRRPAREQ